MHSASPIRIDTIPSESESRRVALVRVCDRKQGANRRVGADDCAVVAFFC